MFQTNFCFHIGCQGEPNFLFISSNYEDSDNVNTCGFLIPLISQPQT